MGEINNTVFISHSSKDIEFILQLNTFLNGLGINKEAIFCSSIEGQGVKQGSRIEDVVKKTLSKSTIIIYVLSKCFLDSQSCMQELGVGWMNSDTKHCFYIKLDDITMSEIKGFLNTSYKFTLVTQESLSEFIDDFLEAAHMSPIRASETVKLIKALMSNSSAFIEKIVSEKDLKEDEKAQILMDKLHHGIENLNLGEMKVVSSLFFSEDQCGSFEINSGVINLLNDKRIVYRLTEVSSFGMYFVYTLQPWVKDYINEKMEFKEKLKKLYKGPAINPYSMF